MYRETQIAMVPTGEPIIRSYFDETDFELAFVTTTDLEGNVVTYISTGRVAGSMIPESTPGFSAHVDCAPIPVTVTSMLAQHRNAIASSPRYIAEANRHFCR
jgi:hypothetical protein